jgi:pyruvate ferredoxin oxidoreductase beta subunit
MSEAIIRSLKDLPSTHLLGGGTAMCAGCGGLQALHEIYDLLGRRTVFVNAAGCMTLLSVYPFTPFQSGFLYTSMSSAPAGAQGVRDALDILRQKGRLAPEEDMTAVVLAGDGASYGMGLSATSAAIERNLDFLYVCYDNEGYGNTGQQASGATPHAARTATTTGAHGYAGYKKDLFAIWAAHRPAYVATVIGSEPLDLAKKIQKAASLEGPSHPRSGALSHRLGLRSEAVRRNRPSRREDRHLAAQGIRRRQSHAHPGAASARAGGGVPEAAGPVRASVRAAAR